MNKAMRIFSLTSSVSFILGAGINITPMTHNPVPEPAMMLLAGSTLIAVSRYFRREKVKI